MAMLRFGFYLPDLWIEFSMIYSRWSVAGHQEDLRFKFVFFGLLAVF